MTRAALIINPISGRGPTRDRAASKVSLARSTLASHGVSADVHLTEDIGHAHRLAQEALQKAVDLVIAWGGDGTINEVASALAFGSVPLGIVPGGSGNGLAGDLGIPSDPVAALAVAATGRERRIDVGDVDGKLFFNVAGVGLDAIIAARFAARGGRRGAIGYLRLMAAELLRTRARPYSLIADGERLERTALMIALANSRQYGIGAFIAPAARLDDGRLELVIVEAQSLVRIVRRMPSLFSGTLKESPGLLMRSVVDVRITGEAPLVYHTDGEPRTGGSTLRVKVHAAGLGVRSRISAT
jgi:YegS/Rv2252/BmrU family lipid kinase